MKERFIDRNIMIPADDQPSEITQPRKRAFHFVPAFISPQFTSILIFTFLVIAAIRADQFDTLLSQSFS